VPRCHQGCNIPNVEVVVQWKLTSTLSSFVQRAGRAGRGPGTSGLAVLLVEKSAYGVNLDELEQNSPSSKQGTKGKCSKSKKVAQAYAAACGVHRGSYMATKDAIVGPPKERKPDVSAPNEGLHALVQTTVCRRRVIASAYGNTTIGERVWPWFR
jgi:superfamily II DNA/RNA helicase